MWCVGTIKAGMQMGAMITDVTAATECTCGLLMTIGDRAELETGLRQGSVIVSYKSQRSLDGWRAGLNDAT